MSESGPNSSRLQPTSGKAGEEPLKTARLVSDQIKTGVEGRTTPTTRAYSKPNRSPPPTQIPAPNAPPSAAVQRTVSTNRTSNNDAEETMESSRDRAQREHHKSPLWPTSPRLKSPPPSTVRAHSSKRVDNGEGTQSNTSIKRLAPVSTPELGAAMQLPVESASSTSSQSNARTPVRGTSSQVASLEPVVESSVPTTPSIGPVVKSSSDSHIEAATLDHTDPETSGSSILKVEPNPTTELSTKSISESQDGGSASAPASRATSTSRPAAGANLAKRSFTSLTGKKPLIEPLRSMTVETETVNPTPQIVVERGRDGSTNVKPKPSTETIRPKKEKRKMPRKPTSLHAGTGMAKTAACDEEISLTITGTSKADIFEAKVASAVDEADSSDSDETFVYESNPPEPRQTRHHSRTPSAASTTSQIDQFGRAKHGVRGGSSAITGKKSMKFSSNVYGNQLDADGGSDVARHNVRHSSTTSRHHHIGRHGRNGHASIIDADSPFSQVNRLTSPRTPTANANRHSRPTSPRVSNGRLTNSRKHVPMGYDTYDDAADDERAPLMGSVRSNRNRYSRRPAGRFRTMDFAEQIEPRCWPRFGGCLFLIVLMTLVAIGVTTFALALNRPLIDVEVRQIQNVLASEAELILDLHIRATNPNLFAITVSDLDVDLFAQSPYAGTSQEWRDGQTKHRESLSARRQRQRSPHQRRSVAGPSSWFPPFDTSDGVDEGNDPIDDPEPGNQKLLIGRIYNFDSALNFDASPFRHDPSSSVGQIRLAQPGNKTVEGGSARWERVIQHPFDLIVRGVIQYQLPLSSRNRSAKISARTKVLPGDDGDDSKNNTVTLF